MSRRRHWGDIYYCDLGKTAGSVQYGIRPVVIIQNNTLNFTSGTVIVAVISTAIKNVDKTNHIIIGPGYGLKEQSMIMIEQIATVDAEKQLMEYIGHIDDKQIMRQIYDGIRFVTGRPETDRKNRHGYIRSLCRDCLNKFIHENEDVIVNRLSRPQPEKRLCDHCKCDYGYDYLIEYKKPREAKYGR